MAVASKTRLPGRWTVPLSLVLLAAWWGVERRLGGQLEATVGPVALVVSDKAYSGSAVVFAIGYLRMGYTFYKLRAAAETGR